RAAPADGTVAEAPWQAKAPAAHKAGSLCSYVLLLLSFFVAREDFRRQRSGDLPVPLPRGRGSERNRCYRAVTVRERYAVRSLCKAPLFWLRHRCCFACPRCLFQRGHYEIRDTSGFSLRQKN